MDELETGLNRNRDSPLEHESQEESHEEGVQNSRTPGDSAQFQTQIELQLYSQTWANDHLPTTTTFLCSI